MPNSTVVPGSQRPCGYQQLAGFTTAQQLTVPTNGRTCLITVTAPCRYRDDGVAPTGSVGFPLPSGTPFEYTGDLAAFRIIPQAGGTATADIVYYS